MDDMNVTEALLRAVLVIITKAEKHGEPLSEVKADVEFILEGEKKKTSPSDTAS